MQYRFKWVVAIALMALLSACSTAGKKGEGEATVEDRSTAAGAEGGVEATGAAGAGGFGAYALDDPNSPLSKRVVYFEYDSFEVMPEDRELISAHATYLAAHPEQTVVLEGHADERGSREYNIALGDQRGQSVRRMLEFQGVAPNQIQVLSYGEEKPAVEGHDESAWRLNRRVELIYSGQ
jgi:peptidoglycan-associated lipoprotein